MTAFTVQILTLSGLLAFMLRFRPPAPSAPLYKPRRFERPGAEMLSYTLRQTAVFAPPPDDLEDLWSMRMTTGEYTTLHTRVHAEVSAELDTIEATMRQGLADLEAFALQWLAADLDAEHALLSIAECEMQAPALERVAARLSDVDTAEWVAGVLATGARAFDVPEAMLS
jgi:hypothetical protein